MKLFTCQGYQPNCWREHHSMSAQSCWEDVRKAQVLNRALLEFFVGINFTRKRLQLLWAPLSNTSPFCCRILGCCVSPHLDENTQERCSWAVCQPLHTWRRANFTYWKAKYLSKVSAWCRTHSLGVWNSLLGTSFLPLTTGIAEEKGNTCFGWGDLDFHTGGHAFPHYWPPLVHV